MVFIYLFLYNHLFAHSFMVSNIPIQNKQFSNITIWPINRTQTGTTTLVLSGSENNGNKEVTPHSPEPQDRSLTSRWSLALYLEQRNQVILNHAIVMSIHVYLSSNLSYKPGRRSIYNTCIVPFLSSTTLSS